MTTEPTETEGPPVAYRVAVAEQRAAAATVTAARQLGIETLTRCTVERLYFLQGVLSPNDIETISRELLADPVTESYTIDLNKTSEADVFLFSRPGHAHAGADHFVDVTLLPGVTDAAADNLRRAAHLLGFSGLERVATGRRYHLTGGLTAAELKHLSTAVLSNPVIQRAAIDTPISPPFFPYAVTDELVETIPLRDAGDERLLAISRERRLALDLAEMRAIRDYFAGEERDPTDAELEMLAQTWSEHCVHKTFKALIDYTGPDGVTVQVDGLLNTYIRAATEKVARPWVRSAFVDDAGIVAFDEKFDLAFKVETHNHPSALEPFGGANTGVGGVVRDVLGVSARPIANTDVLCFGPPDLAEGQVPAGVLHPQRIADGVVAGIEDYGNKMGIPTVNGSIHYDPGYVANPLVYCGCLGLLPRGSHPTMPQPGDLIIAVGGRTGRDGLRGATFSSMEMDVETSETAGSAVQIGNPIVEKQVLEVILRARDEQLYNAITDCGAGGFSSSVGEMGEKIGATVRLDAAPLKYPGLRPWEIWLSEAQERMVLAVPPEKWPRLQEIAAGQDVEATCIGTFEPTGRLRLFYNDRLVGDVAMEFLHDGLPRRQLTAAWRPSTADGGPRTAAAVGGRRSAVEQLLELLSHPNIRSKENVVRVYDHEVQGGTAVKPLVGPGGHGPGDATVLVPLDTVLRTANADGGPPAVARRGVALSNGINPSYGALDPYAMAWAAVDEAVRNGVAVGADPATIAILDNFCWGNPNLPDRLGALVRCAQGCHDAAVAYGTPYISGKDSLNNEYTGADGEKHAIPGTILISALGLVPDADRTATMDLKGDGLLYVVGSTGDELGGSHWALINQWDGGTPPQPREDAPRIFRAVHAAIAGGLVQAVHDCSEGGVAVALAEMALAGQTGAHVDLTGLPVDDPALDATARLFAESLSRFVIEIDPDDEETFHDHFSAAGIPFAKIGTSGGDTFELSFNQERLVDIPPAKLADAFGVERPLTADRRPPRATTGGPRSSPGGPPSAVGRRRAKRALILHANGTNRDREAALACELAGGEAEIVHLNQLLDGERRLADYHMLVLPGGFSYGDDLGAGVLWALDLRHRLEAELRTFVDSGRPVLGICNGFQVLVKAGLLPGWKSAPGNRPVTLTYNASGHFECRWVHLEANPRSPSLFTDGLDQLIYCPVAHGEGRLMVRDEVTAQRLQDENLIALRYVNPAGEIAYPHNPNGSVLDIAGLTNAAGNVLGLMPHPEDHVFSWQHPQRHRGASGNLGVTLFANGLRHA